MGLINTAGGQARAHTRELEGRECCKQNSGVWTEHSLSFQDGTQVWKAPWVPAPGRLSQLGCAIKVWLWRKKHFSQLIHPSFSKSIANPGKVKGRGDGREKQNKEELRHPDLLGLPGVTTEAVGYR